MVKVRRRFITPKCLRKYYSELTWYCPNVTRKPRGDRERIKRNLRAQLSGEISVNLIKIQVNNAQIYEKTSIKGSSAEKIEFDEHQQNDDEEEDEKEAGKIIHKEAAHIIISHESLSQQQQQQHEQQIAENRYELDLTGSIDTQFTAVTTTTPTTNLKTNSEITPHNNNNNNNRSFEGLSVNMEISTTSEVEKIANVNVEDLNETSVEPAKIPTKVFVLNVPRAFTSCSFENPVSLDLSKPEDMVQIIAPQVRNLLQKRTDDETLQATNILEQINDANGMLINEVPSTSKRGRKRGSSKKNITGQPEVKRKSKCQQNEQMLQESEQKSLLEFYENPSWLLENPEATPQPCNDENISLDSNIVKHNYVYNNNELVEFPLQLNSDGYTTVETLENLLKNSETNPNVNLLLASNNANNVDLTLNQIYYTLPSNILDDGGYSQDSTYKAKESENRLNLKQVNQFGEPYVCPVDDAFREGLSMPNIEEGIQNNLGKLKLKKQKFQLCIFLDVDANETAEIAEINDNTIDCPNELEDGKENSNVNNQQSLLEIDDMVGFKDDAEQLMKFNENRNAELTTKRKNKVEILSVVKLNVPLESVLPQKERVLENSKIELLEENDVLTNHKKLHNNDQKLYHERAIFVNLKFCKSKIFQDEMKRASARIVKKLQSNRLVNKIIKPKHLKKIIAKHKKHAKHKTKEKAEEAAKKWLEEQQIAYKENKLHGLHTEKEKHAKIMNQFKLKKLHVKLQRLKINGQESWSSKREHQEQQHQHQLTDIFNNIVNSTDSQTTTMEKQEECVEAKQELDSIEIVEQETVSQKSIVSLKIPSPDVFDECLVLDNESKHNEGNDSSAIKAEMEKIEEVENKSIKSITHVSWAAGSQSPDIFENDCLLLDNEPDSLLCTETEEKPNTVEQKAPTIYDHERLSLNDNECWKNVSRIKKQEEIVVKKSILEQEMDIVNMELAAVDEQDDDVLSLSASSLSDFELEEANIKENTKTNTVKIETVPAQRKEQQVKITHVSSLVGTTTAKTNLEKFKIPKLTHPPTTSTPILRPKQQEQQEQQQQQQQPKLPTDNLFPRPQTNITPKREILPDATTTIQHQERTLPNIRIKIANKNTIHETFKIVDKPNAENETPQEAQIVDDYLQAPIGENYGISGLDLGRIFGIDCFSQLFNNETTQYGNKLLSKTDVSANLSYLNKEDFFAAYRFARNNRVLFEEYAICFTSIMVSRKNVDALMAMIHDCHLYATLAEATLMFIFTALQQCGMESDTICKAIIKRLLENADETYYPLLHATLGLIMVAGHWTRFTVEIEQMLRLNNFNVNFDFVQHMIENCLSMQLNEPYRTLTLQCLMSLRPEVSIQLACDPGVIRFLQLFQPNYNNS